MRTTHFVPLKTATPRLAVGAGLLQGANARILYPPPRYAPIRRARRDIPRIFILSSDTRFETREFENRIDCRRQLEYRRPKAGFPPFAFTKDPPRASLQRCVSRLSLSSIISTEAPKPQFALDEYTYIDDKTDCDSMKERKSSVSQKEVNKSSDKLERKILNTERYNNGVSVPLLGRRRRSRSQRSRSRGSRVVRSRGGGQRATIRALLASSAFFYALAFVVFYFLSLA